MTRRQPIYCPYCGNELGSQEFEGRERGYCRACEEFIFQRPAPTAWTVVCDGRKAVWVKSESAHGNRPWTMPGGFIEVDESAAEAASRELAEETNLRVDPADLDLLRIGFHMDDPVDGSLLSICFVVDRADVRGRLQPMNEVVDVRSCSLESFEVSGEHVRTVDEARYQAAMERLNEVR